MSSPREIAIHKKINGKDYKIYKDFNVSDFFNTKTLSRMTPANSGKATQKHLRKLYRKDPEFRGKVSYFKHLDSKYNNR
jgi:hypothetical protein